MCTFIYGNSLKTVSLEISIKMGSPVLYRVTLSFYHVCLICASEVFFVVVRSDTETVSVVLDNSAHLCSD